MESCVLHFEVPLVIAFSHLVTTLLGFSASESELSLVYTSIRWPRLRGDFHFHTEVEWRKPCLTGSTESAACPSRRLWDPVSRAVGGHWRGTMSSPEESAWAPGCCGVGVAFAAFTWSPSLCACACNYQRHTPPLSARTVLVLVSPNVWAQLLGSCSC